MDLKKIYELQRQFVKEREWEKFHTPKNLSMALSVEASELAEIFQWLTETESQTVMQDAGKAKQVRDEVADVLFYLLRLSDRLGIDVEAAFFEKMEQNRAKYPIEKSKGTAAKYDTL